MTVIPFRTAPGHYAKPTLPAGRAAHTSSPMRAVASTHLGFPYNLLDPDAGAGASPQHDACEIEQEACAWLMRLWQCDAGEAFAGTIGASGSDCNYRALMLARRAFPGARLLYSEEAHLSLAAAARRLCIESEAIACDESGAIDLESLAASLRAHRGRTIIVALTCGTPFKGGHDDIGGAIDCLDRLGFSPNRRFIHVDGALGAMVLPFISEAPHSIQPSFRHAVDSISISGRKMVGTPVPSGALIVRRRHAGGPATMSAPRGEHAAFAMWSRFYGHGIEGFAADAYECLATATSLTARLRAEGVPVLLNPHSLTLVFRRPDYSIVNRYQLACCGGLARAVVLPSTTSAVVHRFVADYLDWWSTKG